MFVFDCPDDEGVRTVGVVCNPVLTLPEGRERRLDDDDEGCLSYPGLLRALPAPRLGARRRHRARRRAGHLRGRRPARPLPAARDRPHARHGLRRPALGQVAQAPGQEARRRRRGLPAHLARGRLAVNELRITRENARFQQWEALLTNRSKRHRTREFLVQGVRPITRAVAEGWTVRALLRADGTTSGWADDLWSGGDGERVVLSPDLHARLSGKEDGAELVAVDRDARGRGDPPRGLHAAARPDRGLRPAHEPRQHRHAGAVGGRLRRLRAGRHRSRRRPLRPPGRAGQHRLACSP